ncbi:YajQ family cyclic di-GMP-binding protein [Heliobacterium chlorum]|uniref:Nucleotide-binding protein H1S01_16155 n=1 Tax=Heliobacterium chlorum TaxID=2698 RepID=A0ABR7T6K1_HELCL|nr:YajQ family cyclic di-GMP-binding protein [Heliobacterium chlorum]MBC9786015.1 YajQ family cyclic di-GMP-binding protein [Heliobacterium chlorum]
MAKEASFDIVSQVDMQEVTNAVHQALKEIENRFDFKNSKSEIRQDEKGITLVSDDDFKLKNVVDILESKMVKRGISLRALKYGKVESAAGDTVRQQVELVQGISKEKAKEITKLIKDSKIKVQAQVQGDQVRVVGKQRDDLQAVIALLKKADLDIELQFINFRS